MGNIEQGGLYLLKDRVGITADKHIIGLWLCVCGNTFKAANSRVKDGTKKSCGCLSIKQRKSNLTHGMRYTTEYRIWVGMKNRCLNPKSKDYHRYGGKGVDVCLLWQNSFEEFYAYVGKRPQDKTLDRINNKLGYQPGNVRWASLQEQQRNRSSSKNWFIRGICFPTAQLAADHFKVSKQTVWKWVNGYTDARRGTTTPPKENCYAEPRY